jgi:hypothetical protein
MSPTKTTSPDVHLRPTGYNAACNYFAVQSLTIRAKAIFRIYAKTTVAPVKAVCRPAPMKIYE